jgi:hypothetical protein
MALRVHDATFCFVFSSRDAVRPIDSDGVTSGTAGEKDFQEPLCQTSLLSALVEGLL